jgi:hypothetical protein
MGHVWGTGRAGHLGRSQNGANGGDRDGVGSDAGRGIPLLAAAESGSTGEMVSESITNRFCRRTSWCSACTHLSLLYLPAYATGQLRVGGISDE